MQTIAIVGAGPKAAAIVARASIIRDLGGKPPNIIVFEESHIGSAWTGEGGFSNGQLTMCTPGEKDVGFPYIETAPRRIDGLVISPNLFSKFSWHSFLISTGRYGEWVDRDRYYPTHALWAAYLKWIFDSSEQHLIVSAVTAIRHNGQKWIMEYKENSLLKYLECDGVVLTGTGKSRSIPMSENVPQDRVFDANNFWSSIDRLNIPEEPTFAIAGDGGAAGTIAAWLAEFIFEENTSIQNINPYGTLFPRGDGYSERRWFSDPTEWLEISIAHRRKVLGRTEAGVVSSRIKKIIDSSPRISYKSGKASYVDWNGSDLLISIDYERKKSTPLEADFLICAIGFDSWSLLSLVKIQSVNKLLESSNSKLRESVEISINGDLSLPLEHGIPPGLHVPSLAGLARGPGMGNLGCLGLMAAAVLRSYEKA